jgi:hypothetical protein
MGGLSIPASTSLTALATRLRRDHNGKLAILVDLSAIANIDSRIVFRSVARFIETRTLDIPLDAVSLARHMLVLLAPPDSSQTIRTRLEALGADLQERRQGSIGVKVFDLATQSEQFVETARQLMQLAPAPRSDRLVPLRDEAPPDVISLNRIIDLTRSLGQAYLANQSRRQTIWRLERDAAPQPLADEIWISIAAIEQITGIRLRNNIWLFGKATELLDQRIMAQLSADWEHMKRPVAINLHLATVVSRAFERLATDKPATQVRQLMVEIPAIEWRADPSLAATARQILHGHDIQLCLDGIGPEDVAALTETDWQDADYLKFDAAQALLSRQSLALMSLPPQHRALLGQKGIFCHCDAEGAVAAGLDLGIRHFQGRGLAPLLEDTDAVTRLLGVAAAHGATAALKGVKAI